jgi:hypothetical protein
MRPLGKRTGVSVMKLALILAAGVMLATGAQAQTVRVGGHVNKNGVYVPPHYRTAPDSTIRNNWSTAPNVNPYTGRVGTVSPYAPPSYAPKPLYTPPAPYKPYKPKPF